MTASFTDRRNAASKEVEISLLSDQIIVSQAGLKKQAVPLDSVKQVRLAIEMAGQDTQIVCRVTAQDGTQIVFGSRRFVTVGSWENNADTFRTFLAQLHRAFKPYWPHIDFVEGQSLSFRWIMSGLGVLMAIISATFAIILVLQDKSAGFFLVAPLVLGVWLAWLFRPQRPKPYDPSVYAGQ